ncbi:MAG: hypothetical protein JSV59_09210 [Flavobacteriaceae bacterium]|nr:MAG: hypothetical protein JSV59_09210 [Flavobacteriaceae bacterium]
MLEYLIKFSACLLAFFLFYKLFLEKESFHVYKRIFLLSSVLFSGIIPLIPLAYFQVELPDTMVTEFLYEDYNFSVSPKGETGSEIWQQIPLFIYLTGLTIMGGRFIFNLNQIFQTIRKNPKLKGPNHTKVLLANSVVPHTFLKYIFLNRDQYLNDQIPIEVIIHEESHVSQKHSFDILFIEFVHLILWFNPLIYLLKNSIKLNHEFLADKDVINKGIKRQQYWNTLISFDLYKNQPGIVHAINYSSIKKRLLVMKKETSKISALTRQLGVISVTCLAMISFGNSGVTWALNQSHNSSIRTEGKYAKIPKVANDPNRDVVSKKPISNLNEIIPLQSKDKSATREVTYLEDDRSPSPLEFMKEMKDQNAQFYYNEESISSEQAVNLVRDARKIDLIAMHTGLEKPIVKLSNAELSEKHDQIPILKEYSP